MPARRPLATWGAWARGPAPAPRPADPIDRWGCSCSLTIRWLAAHGGAHARRISAAHLPEDRWSLRDWFAHFAEEDRLLFRYFPIHIQRLLRRHHAIFRTQLRLYGTVDADLMRHHAAIEDAYTKVAAPPIAA